MEPATRIIELMGGTKAVSEICGVHISQVHKWTWEKSRGGSDGVIPMKHAKSIVDHSRSNGMAVTPDSFFEKGKTDD